MASPGNPNQPGGGPFDSPRFFKPSTPSSSPSSSFSVQPLTSTNYPNPSSNHTNPNLAPPQPLFPLPSASYPPPTGGGGGGGGPYPFQHPTSSSPFHHHPPPQFVPPFLHQQYPPPSSQDPPPPSQFSNHLHPHAQRSMSFPTPPLQPPLTTSPHPGQFTNQQNLSNGNNVNNQNHNNQTPGARLMALLSATPSSMEMHQQSGVPLTHIQPTISGGSDLSLPHSLPMMVSGPNVGFPIPGPTRLPSSKLPKGRHLVGFHAVYDIDVRLPGEVQPQLEVTPITKYGSDPGLVLGRQIAVNKTYICYGLKQGAVRVLNINTALRSLLKGLAQRVTDMAFFAEDVHLLASASVDGRVYVWKIAEDQDEEDKPQITGKIVIAVQFNTEGESVHPRVCWHCHKQEVLVVGIGRHILKIDTTKVGKREVYSAEEPLRCSIDRLIDGIQLVGSHDGEITDLSMCQWMTTRLVSASVDGTIKIWEDRKMLPIAVLRPHDGQPVNSVTFLTASHRPDHIILITGGPLNREVKIWVSASEEGWLLPSDSESWRCIQTLELKSSAESHMEEAFFNQVVALPQAGLLLLANAKKNAIYAVHLDFGSYPASSRMDYVAEFTVTMPILSFTGTSDLHPNGEQIVQVYCVQTQAIQQYALDLSLCLPSPIDNPLVDKTESGVSRDALNADVLASEPYETKATEIPASPSAPTVSARDSGSETAAPARQMVSSATAESSTSQEFPAPTKESKSIPLPVVMGNNDLASIASTSLPLSPRLSGNLSGLRTPSKSLESGPSVNDTSGDSVDRPMDGMPATVSDVGSTDHEPRNNEDTVLPNDISSNLNHHVQFKHPTHLITPSEILMANSSSEVTHVNDRVCDSEVNIQDVVTVDDPPNVEVDVKVVGETRYTENSRIGSHGELHTFGAENNEKSFYSQTSDLGMQMARESHALSPDNYTGEESRQVEGVSRSDSLAQPSASEEDIRDATKNISGNDVDSDAQILVPQASTPQASTPNTKGKKQTGKNTLGSGILSLSPSAFNSTESSNDVGAGSSIPSLEAAFSQMMSMQETLNQLANMQKEMQKQMTMIVAVPVTKEGRRLEAALGKNIEKSVKANNDALWARFQEDNVKQEKSSKERNQQMTSLINNCLNRDLPTIVEKAVKKELATLGQAVARTIAPTIEKAVSSSISESFQKGVADKAVNQLEKSLNSKLESTVARQIQAQFQTSGKQALQESLKTNLEASVIPSFELSCKAMFEQLDAAFQKGMSEHTTAALQQFEATHSTVALALRDSLNSASSVGQMLSSELADGQRKLVALAVAGANSKIANPLVQQISNGPLSGLHEKPPEAPLDPTKELTRLIAERKYEEAFSAALQRSDVTIVSWLCSQVDLTGIMTMNPLPLSQGVLLSLLQQLACDIVNDSSKKVLWMRDVVTALNPSDPMIAVHVRPIFQQVYSILEHRRNVPTIGGSELSNIRLIHHVINSMLMTCK